MKEKDGEKKKVCILGRWGNVVGIFGRISGLFDTGGNAGGVERESKRHLL